MSEMNKDSSKRKEESAKDSNSEKQGKQITVGSVKDTEGIKGDSYTSKTCVKRTKENVQGEEKKIEDEKSAIKHDISESTEKVERQKKKSSCEVKIGLIGDVKSGKTSIMVRYVENTFCEDYAHTVGLTFMEKTVNLKNTDITFQIWDLGGNESSGDSSKMLQLVCKDADILYFTFDLSRESPVSGIKKWYKLARGLNKTAFPFLVGTKYDIFATKTLEEKTEITKAARKVAKAMKAPLIFCSAANSTNVVNTFKVILSRLFRLQCNVARISSVGDPILEF